MSQAIRHQKKLSNRQQNMLDFIKHFLLEHGYPPTLREIMADIDSNSTSVIRYNIGRLARLGYLTYTPHISRSIRLLDATVPPQAASGNVTVPLLWRIIHVPELGIPRTNKQQSIPHQWLAGVPYGEVYAVEVSSYHMYDTLVKPGDVIVLQHTDQVADGDTAILKLPPLYESRIRRVFFKGEMIELDPMLKSRSRQTFRKTEVQILGKVLGMLRQF